jgi:hypothetical protein
MLDNKIINLMSINRILYIIYFLTVFPLYSYSEILVNQDSIIEDIVHRFEKMLIQNNINDQIGQSHLNQYILFPKNRLFNSLNVPCDPTQTECSCWIETATELPTTVTTSLCQRYTAFNNANPGKVQHYIIIEDYSNQILKSDMLATQKVSNTPFSTYADYLSSTDAETYKNMYTTLYNRISISLQNFPTGNITNPEKIVTIAGEYVISINGKNQGFSSWYTRNNDPNSVFLTKNLMLEFEKTCKINASQDQSEIFGLASWMETTISFFTNKIHPNATCLELKGGVTHEEAKDYIEVWCAHLELGDLEGLTLDYIRNVIYPIAQYIDQYHFLRGVSIWSVIDEEDLIFDPQEYLAYLQESEENGYLSYLNKLKAELILQCNNVNHSTGQGLNYILANADSIFYTELSGDELICLTKLYINLYNGAFSEWLESDDYRFFLRVFDNLVNNIDIGHNEAVMYANSLSNIPFAMHRLFEACDYFANLEVTEKRLVELITKFSYKVNSVPPIITTTTFGNNLFIWNTPGALIPCGFYSSANVYYYCIDQETGIISVRWDVYDNIIDIAGPVNDIGCYIDVCEQPANETYDYTFSPFNIVGIVGGGEAVTIFSDCSNYSCQMPLKAISAFELAWLIEKKYDSDGLSQFLFSVEVIGAFFGVTEIVEAWRAQEAVKWAYMGMTATDVLASEMTINSIQSYAASQGYENFQQAQKILTVLQLGATISAFTNIAIGLSDAVRAVSIKRSMQLAGDDFTGGMNSFKIRCDDINELIEANVFLVRKALEEVGLDSKIIDDVLAIGNSEIRTAVLGRIFTNQAVVSSINKQPKIIDFLVALYTDTSPELHKLVLSFNDDLFESLIKDIEIGQMATAFKNNVHLVENWSFLVNGPERLKRSVIVIQATEEFHLAGFINADFETIFEISNKLALKQITNLQNCEAIEGTMLSAARAKNLSYTGINKDVLGQLDFAVSSSHYLNTGLDTRGLMVSMDIQLNTSKPGFLEQLNEGFKRLELNHDIKIESLDDGSDILDFTASEAIQMKSVTSSSSQVFKDNLYEAMGQFATEIPPVGFNKVADIRLRNSSIPQFNSSQSGIRDALQDMYDNGSSAFRGKVEQMKYFDITNNAGNFRYEFITGSFQIVN